MKKKLRNWHIWLGVLVSIPLLVVGLSTIFIAHGKKLKLDDYLVNANYFPGYASEKKRGCGEISAYLMAPDKREFYGYKDGLAVVSHGILREIDFFRKHHVRSFGIWHGKIVVGTKNGLFVESGAEYEEIFADEVWGVVVQNEKLVVITKESMLEYKDGKWKAINLPQRVQEEGARSITLKKLNMDLHTGKALFGDKLMWIWQDILALSILFFMMSGVFLWFTKKQQRRA